MAFYNPQKIAFNPNTGLIQATGAVGTTLWDMYNKNLQNKQNQSQIDETKRHHEATEKHQADSLNQSDRHFNENLAFGKDKFNAEQAWKQKTFNFDIDKFKAEQDFRAKQHADNMFYKNLALQDRIDTRAEKQREKEIELTHKMQAQDAEAYALAEQYADDAYLAGHFKALNDDGSIDKDKLTNAIVTNYKINPRSAVSGINKILSEKRGFDANLAQMQTLKNIATLNEQLGKIPEDKRIDDYDGWIDRAGDKINALFSGGEDKKAVESILHLLNNSGYQMAKTGRGTEQERKEFNKEYGVTLNSAFTDNDQFAKAQKLQDLSIPAMKQELVTKRDGASNTYTKQFYDKEIQKLDEINQRLNKLFGAKPKDEDTKPKNVVKEF